MVNDRGILNHRLAIILIINHRYLNLHSNGGFFMSDVGNPNHDPKTGQFTSDSSGSTNSKKEDGFLQKTVNSLFGKQETRRNKKDERPITNPVDAMDDIIENESDFSEYVASEKKELIKPFHDVVKKKRNGEKLTKEEQGFYDTHKTDFSEAVKAFIDENPTDYNMEVIHNAIYNGKKLSQNRRHFLSQVPSNSNLKKIEILRRGTFSDPRYGEFKVTKEMLLSMVENFKQNVAGQMIMLDVAHKPSDGAAGVFKDISTDGEKLYGVVELTEFGKQAIQEKNMVYISAEYDENFKNNEGGDPVGATLLGAALTTRPVVKNMQPIKLSLDALQNTPVLCSNELLKELAVKDDQKDLSMTEEEKKAFAEKMKAAREGKSDDKKDLEEIEEEEETEDKELANPNHDKLGRFSSSDGSSGGSSGSSGGSSKIDNFISEIKGMRGLGREKVVEKLKKIPKDALASVVDKIGMGTGTSVKSKSRNSMISSIADDLDDHPNNSMIESFFEKKRKKNKDLSMKDDEDVVGLGLNAEQVKAIVAEELKANQEKETKKGLAEQQNKALLLSEIDAAQGLEDNTKETLKKLSLGLISPDMDSTQVKALAALQIEMANSFVAEAKLKALGFQRQGSIGRIDINESNKIKQLQQSFDAHLPIQFEENNLNKLVKEALHDFDARNEQRLLAEADMFSKVKRLAGGSNGVGDFVFPAVVERSVLRQALFSLTATQFVNVGTAPFSTTYDYYYAERDATAAGPNQTRVYEMQAIPAAGLGMKKVSAYPIPQKLSMNLSIESMLLFQNANLNMDLYADLVSEMARIIQEDTDISLFNEQINSADEYGAIPITDELLTSQVNGTKKVFCLAHFPVVLPRKIFSLDGVQIGATTNPIVTTYAGNVIQEYKPNQAAGFYYKIDLNLGEISICNETGTIITPANGTTLKVSYSYATNCVVWDMDIPSGVDIDVHYDGLLRIIGQRKAQLVAHPRLAKPDFILMSETIMNAASEAKSFLANFSKPGTELNSKGSLGKIKAIPVYSTNNPFSMLTDQRILMGESGQTRFRMLQPWQMQGLQDMYNSNGKPVGAKQAYGVQYIGIDTPPSLKNRLSSVVLYSSSARIPR